MASTMKKITNATRQLNRRLHHRQDSSRFNPNSLLAMAKNLLTFMWSIIRRCGKAVGIAFWAATECAIKAEATHDAIKR